MIYMECMKISEEQGEELEGREVKVELGEKEGGNVIGLGKF